MPKSFRLRQQPSKAPTSNTDIHVEVVGVSEVEELTKLKEQFNALSEEFTKLKEEQKNSQKAKEK